LAKSVAEIYQANPKVQGLILLRQGIFTFAENPRDAYELMIEMVTLAEERLKRGKKTLAQVNLPAKLGRVADIAPILRGACTLVNDRKNGVAKRQILDFRTNENPALRRRCRARTLFAARRRNARSRSAPRTAAAGSSTGRRQSRVLERLRARHRHLVAGYHAYFARNNARVNGAQGSIRSARDSRGWPVRPRRVG
jgi:hypothetical protein